MMIHRTVTALVVLLVVATSGNGQAWLLHSHDEYSWHVHAIDPSGGLGQVYGDSRSDDSHEHDETLPLDPSDEGVVVVLKSAPAIASCSPVTENTGAGVLSAIVLPIFATTTSAMTADARPGGQCAHTTTASRAVESLLRSNHALLI